MTKLRSAHPDCISEASRLVDALDILDRFTFGQWALICIDDKSARLNDKQRAFFLLDQTRREVSCLK